MLCGKPAIGRSVNLEKWGFTRQWQIKIYYGVAILPYIQAYSTRSPVWDCTYSSPPKAKTRQSKWYGGAAPPLGGGALGEGVPRKGGEIFIVSDWNEKETKIVWFFIFYGNTSGGLMVCEQRTKEKKSNFSGHKWSKVDISSNRNTFLQRCRLSAIHAGSRRGGR